MKKILFILFLLVSLLSNGQDYIEWISGQGSNCKEYGLLYNWYAASDPNITSGNGWEVPESTDVLTLANYIDNYDSYYGYYPLAGGYLKTVGEIYWSNNVGATNDYLFNAVGAGERLNLFTELGTHFNMWNYNDDGEFMAHASIIVNTETLFDVSVLGDVSYVADKSTGMSIRLVRPATESEQLLDDGTYVDNYVGNDLTEYPAVKIGTQVWLAKNLYETKFRNGDVIPSHGLDNDSTFTDTEWWSELTYAGTCAYNDSLELVACNFTFPEFEYANAKYGYLYNWYVVSGDSLSSSSDWAVPTDAQYNTLITYLGGTSAAGHKLREANSVYWNTIINNTNESEFNARGGGYRNLSTGAFANIKASGIYHTKTASFGAYSYVLQLPDNGNATLETGVGTVGHKKTGASIRLIYTGSGTPTTYTGNDGKVYKVVKIGTQYWLSENLCETKYRLGSTIPTVTNNTTWSGLTTGAKCAYDNLEENVR